MSRRERLRAAETAWLLRFSIHEKRRFLRFVMLAATRLADGWGLAILIPGAILIAGRSRGVAAIGLGVVEAVTTAVVVQSIKALVRRSRPAGIDLARPITAPDEHAFPSGHTAQAFGMILIAWYVSPWLGAATAAVAVLVGASRMFFGLHYPTDVVVGALLGLTVAWSVLWTARETGLESWLQRIGAGGPQEAGAGPDGVTMELPP